MHTQIRWYGPKVYIIQFINSYQLNLLYCIVLYTICVDLEAGGQGPDPFSLKNSNFLNFYKEIDIRPWNPPLEIKIIPRTNHTPEIFSGSAHVLTVN